MVLRSIVESLRSQNWNTAFAELLIVVVGVFIGLQADNWNDARLEAERKEQFVDVLTTYLSDTNGVQEEMNAEIELGLLSWESAVVDGNHPPPYFFRHDGSDTAPDTWATFNAAQLTDLFDPVTLFDLTFYFSEVDGVGEKHVRYVTFVENEILPGLISEEDIFYDKNGRLKARFQANMDRLREHTQDNLRLIRWAECIAYRLEANRTFDQSCLRVDFRLDGMGDEVN
jgi:hypothetical protein